MTKKENVKITHEVWVKGSPEEVIAIIESLEDQGYETIESVCKAFNRKVVKLE